jgi:hypothetical protein
MTTMPEHHEVSCTMTPHPKEEDRMRKWMSAFNLVVALVALTVGISAYAAKPSPPPPPPFNCKWVVCAAPDCLDNEHLEVPAGACCPVCVPN